MCSYLACPAIPALICFYRMFYVVPDGLPNNWAQVCSGWGYTLAKALAKEATRSFLQDLHCKAGAATQGSHCHHLQVDAA